jgi:hypothetical protein
MWNAQGGRRAVFGAALFLSVAAAPARADEAPAGPAAVSVVVVPYAPVYGQAPQSIGDKVTEAISSEVANDNTDFKAVPLAGAKKEAAETKPKEDGVAAAKPQIEAATEALTKGISFAQARKFKPAVDTLEHGITQFLANFQGADDFKALSDAYVQLALARLKLGNDDGASKALEDLIRLDPERTLADPIPKELINRHAKQRAAFLAKPRGGSMRIDSVPAGARVTIDGRDLGETPLIAQAVLPGEHYVRVVKDGIGAAWEKIAVGHDEETASFTLAEEHASGPLAAISKGIGHNTVDADLLKSVAKLGAASKAEYVVFGGIRKNASTSAYDVKSYSLHVKDGAVTELADISLDEELLGANVEALKVVTDLAQKIQGDTFAAPQGNMTLFEGSAQPKNAAPTTIALAPASAGAVITDEGEKSGPAPTPTPAVRHRGPAVAETPETPAPAPAVTATENPDEDVLQKMEDKRRKRHKADDDEETTKPKEEQPPPEDDTGATNEPKPKVKHKVAADEDEAPAATAAAGDEDSGDEETPAPAPKKTVKKKTKPKMSSLTPEQLQEMKAAEDAANSKTDGGMIALWTSVGVVGAVAIGVGAYFLFRTPPAASSATAHIAW